MGVGSQPGTIRLPRSLSALETWGFGLTGLLGWVTTAPAIHAALGASAIFVWLPAVIAGVLLNLQVKRLGEQWPEMSGGTPNYITRLLSDHPSLGRYAAIAYFLAWAAYPSATAFILTDIVKANLEPWGVYCPETVLKIGFASIAYIVAFSGTRTLGILHAFFMLPAVGFLLVFCIQGLGWLAFSPDSPGFFPTSLPPLTFREWLKWFFFAIYTTCACETASSFVADSRQPGETLRILSSVAWLIPPVFLGSSWVLARLATSPGLGDNPYFHLVAAAAPFWGTSATLPVTLLLASSCLLIAATSVANAPRILYQLSLDGYVSPLFQIVSPQGALQPALALGLCINLLALVSGDVTRFATISGAGYMAALMAFHLGLWLRRRSQEVRWGWLSLGLFAVDATLLVMVGLGWSWQDLAAGLLFPLAFLAFDAAIRRISFPPFHPAWWVRRTVAPTTGKFKDFLVLQVVVLIVLVCSAATAGWVLRALLDRSSLPPRSDLLVVVLLTIAFVAIAIACWTSLPQVAAIAEARERAESLFIAALDTVPDTVLVLDASGAIQQANRAAETLFRTDIPQLIGSRLNHFFSELPVDIEQWPKRSERTFSPDRIIEITLSHRRNRKQQEYVAILRDITGRVRAEAELWQALQLKEQLAATATAQALELEKTLQELRQAQAQLMQSVESDRVLTQITDQIRRTLDLKTILQTIVREVLALLNTDRVVIYQFTRDWQGEVVVEAVNGRWKLLQGDVYADECFPTEYARLYSYGRVKAVDSIAESDLHPCHKKFLLNLGIQANLVVPVRIDYLLWGLLIAHECSAPRVWQPAEIELLQQLANQAAIAIQQAELYQQSQSAAEAAAAQAKQLEQALQQIQQTQTQLIQTEKMSSLGQLVAGVAHEINNPVNFIYGNITHADDYAQDLLALINLYQERYPNPDPEIQDLIEEIELDFLVEDLPKTLSSMKVGAERIRQIVLTLRNFSRLDEAEMKPVNIHEGIESSLLILQNRLKAKPDQPGIQIVREYGDLPEVECYAGQLNQVFMNLLNNSIDALQERDRERSREELKKNPSTITIRTQRAVENNWVAIAIEDNGPGIPESARLRIFDPFFTTKPVGEGTGLGLSISYQIVADKHGGRLKCVSEPGQGAEFWIEIPIRQTVKKV
ncbi:MAG: GAF domain-containing protein [Oscillatoria princeps RMCB-10]|jgi:PAS domain S-box-containing protein|nr:GAF domain-containing protein [Oscillatoria princeps RMCB-10]